MKHLLRILLKSTLYVLLFLLLALMVLPLFFKNEITRRAEKELNNRLTATVTLEDLGLSFFSRFPNLTINLKDLRVIGIDDFEDDTLLSLPSFKLVVNPFSLLGKEGPRVTSLIIGQPNIHLKVLESGLVNYDILRETEGETPSDAPEPEGDASALTLNLKSFRIEDAQIRYDDYASETRAVMNDFQFLLKGRLGLTSTLIHLKAEVSKIFVEMGGIPYLNNATMAFVADLGADLEQMKFSFQDNRLRINALQVQFDGDLDLHEENPNIQLRFQSVDNDFKSLLSLVPAIYASNFEAIETSGKISLEGQVDGTYASNDSLYPDFDLRVEVDDAMFRYPSLPASVDAVNLLLNIRKQGRTLDEVVIDLQQLSMKIANQPLEAALLVDHPISDPTIKAWMKTKMDLSALEQALPMGRITMLGSLQMEVTLDGQLSSLQMGQYDHFQAQGFASLEAFEYRTPDIPVALGIPRARLDVSPELLDLSDLQVNLGESDFQIQGNLRNYLGYILKEDLLTGSLKLESSMCDLNAIMPLQDTPDDTSATSDSLTSVSVPGNIDFRFVSHLDEVRYTNITLKDVNGLILVKQGALVLEGLDMDVLDGEVLASGSYDTSDSLKPLMTMMLRVDNIDIPAAFNAFNMVQSLTPFARDLRGKVSATLDYSSLIGPDFKPVVSSMVGSGSLRSEEVQVLNSRAFDQFKTLFKMNDQITNTFKDLDLSFGMVNGRLIVDPFDVLLAGGKVNVSGDHGLDQSLNYLLKTNIPRASLGSGVNQLADQIASQAEALGLDLDPGDQIPVHVKITGKIGDPRLTPSIGERSAGQGTGAIVREVREEIIEQKERLEQEVRKDVSEEVEKIMKQAEIEAENVRKLARETADQVRKEGYSAAEKVENEAKGKGMIAENIARKAADKLRQEADRQAGNIIREADEKATLILENAREKARALEEGNK
jgi:hypothetical protein